MTNLQDRVLTGYASIDKPWLKYYLEEAKAAPLPKTSLYDYVLESNQDRMNAIALDYYGHKIRYSSLFENIRRTAAAFYAYGIREGDMVTILSLITPETVYCIYALNFLGATANMVYLSLAENEIKDTIEQTNSKMVVALELVADKAVVAAKQKNIPLVILQIDSSMNILAKMAYRKERKKIEVSIEQSTEAMITYSDFIQKKLPILTQATYEDTHVAMIVYTSGTTGIPKGVMLGNDSINAVVHQYRHMGFNFEQGDTMLTFMPPFFAIGFSLNVHMPLSLGLRSVMEVNPEPVNVTNRYMKVQPNHFVAAPSNVIQVMESINKDMSWCKVLAGGGEAMTLEQEERINTKLKQLHSKAKYSTGYGMSEFAATVTSNSNKAVKSGSLGIPLLNTTVRIIDTETGAELPYGQEGEICFSTPSRMLGYYQNEEATKEIMWQENGETWIRTGDLGMVDEDGFVHFKGRLKRIYMVKGEDGTLYKLFPAHMEEELDKHELVHKCAVCVVDASEILHKPIAFIVPSREIHEEELSNIIKEYCREVLPTHSIPDQVILLDKIPMTQSGKTDYQKLEKRIDK